MNAVEEWQACLTICTSAVGRPSYCMDLSRGPISPPAGNRSQDIYPISLYRLLMRSLIVSNQSYRFRRLEITATGDWPPVNCRLGDSTTVGISAEDGGDGRQREHKLSCPGPTT